MRAGGAIHPRVGWALGNMVCNEEEMQQMVATLLLLLEVENAARDEGNGLYRNLRVPQDNPPGPLASPEGGRGLKCRARVPQDPWVDYSSLKQLGKPDYGQEFNRSTSSACLPAARSTCIRQQHIQVRRCPGVRFVGLDMPFRARAPRARSPPTFE